MTISGEFSYTQDMRVLVKELRVNGKDVLGAQAAKIEDVAVTASTGDLPTPNGAVTVANAASPTVGELLEFCVELNAKLNAVIAALEGAGISASS